MEKLVLDNVGITYFGGYRAVSGVSFTLHRGEVMTVFGELGSGKSSLLKLIATLEKPTSGTIKVDDKPIEETELRYQNIAFATNELPLMKGKTVYENIAYPLKIRKVDNAVIDVEVKKIAKRCGLYNILDEKVKFIGEDVRAFVILARAFVLVQTVIWNWKVKIRMLSNLTI